MRSPTIADIPGIILRTIARTIARVLFLVAALLLLAGLGLTFASLLLATWRSPRGPRTQLIAELITIATQYLKDRRKVTQSDSH